MGFLYHAMTITFFLNIFSHARFLFICALTHLGLYKQQQQQPPPPEEEEEDTSNNYILILDSSSPSLVPIHVQVVTAAIKNKVPILHYQHLDQQKGWCCCSICLECIELSDEVRELSNCSHVFHRVCLDTWIDAGQVTCPLCRSMLLSPKAILLTTTGCKLLNNNNNHPPHAF